MVDFTRFMGRGALEPRFAPMPLEPLPAIKPAPQVKAPAPAPAPAPLPSVEPAPMPAPVAPLPTPIPSFSPDPMNIPGLPQLPMPAPVPPVAQPAPVPAPVPMPVPLPQVEPMPPVKPVETTPPIMELPNVPPVPVTPPPMVEPTPVPAPVPVTPPPTPPTPVAPPPMVEPTPVPAPVPVTPPPLPPQPVPTPVAPPPVVEPAPTPTPITPPPTPPTPGFDMLEPRFEVEPGVLPNLPAVPTPVAPPPAVEPTPAPTPVAPEFTLPPELLENLPPMVRPPVVEPMPTPAPTPVSPEPAVGIETLAPEDFTAPAGIVAGPMSTPSVNNRVEEAEASIPLPSGGQFNLDRMEFDTESIPEVDPQIIQNALADAGLAPAPVIEPAPVAEPAPTITPNLGAGLTLGDTYLTEPEVNLFNERELADMGGAPATRGDMVFAGGTPNFDERTGQYVEPTPEPAPTSNEFTLTPEQQAAVDAAIAQGEFGFTGDSFGFTDGQQDAAGVAPGAVADTASGTPAPPYANQAFYQNMTPEQQAAYDAFIESGGIANLSGGTIDLGAIGGGTVNIPGLGGYTVPTVRPTVEAIQNLAVNRDPTVAGNVSAATQYGLTGATPAPTQRSNPFERPETQQGIGSLAGGG